jgi:hypothetical protein
VASTVHVALVAGSADDCPVLDVLPPLLLATERRGERHAARVATGHGVTDLEPAPLPADDEDAAVAAADDLAALDQR